MIQLDIAPLGSEVLFYLGNKLYVGVDRKIISSNTYPKPDVQECAATIVARYWGHDSHDNPARAILFGWKDESEIVRDYCGYCDGRNLFEVCRLWILNQFEFVENLHEYKYGQWARSTNDIFVEENTTPEINTICDSSMPYISAKEILPGDTIAWMEGGALYHSFVEDISEDENILDDPLVHLYGRIYCKIWRKNSFDILGSNNKILLINRTK